MEVRAIVKNLRVTPKKIKIPVDVVRGMSVAEALPTLKYMNKKAAKDVYKLVHSAFANANQKDHVHAEDLFITKIAVGEGMRLRRFRAGSRGNPIYFARRNAHVEVVLSDQKVSSPKAKAEKVEKKKVESKPKAAVKKPVAEKKQTKAKKVTKSAK